MSEYLISWLNNEIRLSKKITNIPKDFNNGYLFAELLYKTKQLPSLKIFKNSSVVGDILQNFSILEHFFNEMDISFNDNNKRKILNNDKYTSFFYLHKIKQVLDRKCINLKQIHLKNSNTLSKLFNNMIYKNDTDKYLLHVDMFTKKAKMKNKNFSYNKSTTFFADYKNNVLAKEIKSDYSNLNLNDQDVKMIVDNIEDNTNKYKVLRTNIYNLKKNKKQLNLETETNNLKNWTKSLVNVNNFKIKQKEEKFKPVNYYRSSVNKEFRIHDKKFQFLSKNFDNKLQYFGRGKFDKVKDQEGLSKIIISQMIQKLNDRLKNKKQKEKNERKRLREEQQMANLNLLNRKNQSPPLKFEKLLTDINVTKNNYKTIDIDNDIDKINYNKVNNIKSEMEKTISTMSKLTYNDLGTEPINNSKILHWNNIKIGNRIDFFKTIMFNDENANKKELPQINLNENREKPFKQNKTVANIFDKVAFFERMNKEDYLINKKTSIIRLNKRNKKKEEVKVILEQILDLTNYISSYQTKNDMKLLESEKWGELMKMFLREEKFHKEKKDLKHFLETQKLQETKKNKEALIREKKCEQELYDYVNYIGIFNDLVIPNENDIKNINNNNKNRINKEFTFIEIYSDFYDPKKNGGIDINEYEPSQDEIDNLIIPQYPDYESNKKLNFIIQHIIETEMEFSNKDESPNKKNYNNLLSMIIDDKNNIIEKGKYFYLPIKICFTGYPLAGKKVQSNLIQEKYPNIKVYNPEQILNDKINEYNSISTPIEKEPNFKKLKHNQIEELKKQKEEKLKEFEPILNIISPILDNKEENKNETNDNKNDKNDSEVKSDIYMKLLINELNRDFPDDKEQKVQMINEFKEKYNEYNNVTKNINEIHEKINEEEEKMKEANANPHDKKPKKNNNIANYQKELVQLNKDLDTIKSSLFRGFIIINFPSNEKEAKLLENYFTGYVSEYEKEIDPIELRMKKYDYIIDYNYKKEKNKETQFSFFDYIINFEISSNEIDRRYNGIKYDPVTHKVYHNEDNPPPANDKKVMQRLIDGLPGKNKDDINNEKEKYDLENRGLSNFYKNMSNGINNVYLNIDTMNKNISDTNENIISYLENIMFNYYFMNIDVILNKINSENIQSPPKEKEKEKENEKNKEDSSVRITNELELSNVNSANKESSDTFLKDSSKNKVLIDYLYNKFTSFADKYKTYIKLFIQFIIEQKEDIFNYLNKKQALFVEYLNRKTNNTEIAELYIKKYNSLFIKHPDLRQNEIVYNELMNDITDVKNSIWVSMQTKKKENVKFLQDIKNENVSQQEEENFWQFLTNIIEIEINRYLIFCEIILKYYLSKIGIIYEILDKNNIDIAFTFDFQKILYSGIEVNNDDDVYDIKKTKKRDDTKSIKQNFEIIIKNIVKIIVKEDEIIKKYQDIITNLIKHSSSEQNLSQTKKAKSTFKKKPGGISYSEVSGFNEEINEIINKEKNKLKYRMLFLKYFSLKYHDTINNCFDETFVEMDKWITFNIRVQNNILNDFINYLTRSLNKNLDTISLNNMDFDESINLNKYKIKVSDIYNKINVNGILDIYSNSKEHKLILLENLNYTQSFSYSLNDLLNIYNSLKESGTYPFPYIIKYNIVYELFIKKYLIQKGYNILLNNNNNKEILNQNNQNNNNEKNTSLKRKSNKRNHSRTLHSNSKINSSSNKVNVSISKVNNISTTRGSEIFNHDNCLKGISKKLLGLSNAKYQKLLSIFELYENKYININELFTTLLIIGSELITPNQFWDSIQGSLPENKINEKRILLTKEEFMNIKFWFENDEYLNNPCDEREFEIYKNFENEVEDKNNNGKEYKIKKIKESIFEINAEEELFDIEIFKTILNKLHKTVIASEKLRKKEESFISTSKISVSLDKNNKSSIDQNMRKSASDSAKQTENEMKSEEKNKNSYLITKNKLNPEIENNIFDNLFLN